MNNPFDYTPDEECREAFRLLNGHIGRLKESVLEKDRTFCRELEAGKMLGVMIAADESGRRHALWAFSGQAGDLGFTFPGFVGPVLDYLRPGGYFKTREADISRQNADIAEYEKETLVPLREEYERAAEKMNAEVEAYREECRLSKARRDAARQAGETDPERLAAMIQQSQFEKAELRRRRKRAEEALKPSLLRLREAEQHLEAMKARRRSNSEALQKWLFDSFTLLNARGESKSLSEIFADTPLKAPPSGAGECCAPKLLQEAYRRRLRPVSMAEYWYGRPKDGEVRIHGHHYPACRGKCLPVLRWMLQGMDITPPLDDEERAGRAVPQPEIIYENRWFCVVSKPAGMLSVPGKGKAISVQDWLTARYGSDSGVKPAHRLDRDTSGLLIATFGPRAFKEMQRLFASRQVRKTYIADLEGNYHNMGIAAKGRITLPLAPDILDRPRQRIDFEDGKEAVTDYEFTGVAHGRSRVELHPLTGRTHQLRVHAASNLGLGMPIVGDPLYGASPANPSTVQDSTTGQYDNAYGQPERLHLHARTIEFTFPLDGRHYRFDIPAPF